MTELEEIEDPECPTERWWQLAGAHPLEAMTSVLYPILTLEDPARWMEVESYCARTWALGNAKRLPPREARLFAADCAERALPVFERAYPKDKRPRHAIKVARAYANGTATEASLRKASEACEEACNMADNAYAQAAGDKFDTGHGDDEVMAAEVALSAARAASWAAELDRPDFTTQAVYFANDASETGGEGAWQWARLKHYLRGEGSRVGAKLKNVDNPLLSRRHWINLALRDRLAALRHPNAPVDLLPLYLNVERKAGRADRLAAIEANPALDMLLREDASDTNPLLVALWRMRYEIDHAELREAGAKLNPMQALLWAYRCAEKALPAYRKELPGDDRAAKVMEAVREYLTTGRCQWSFEEVRARSSAMLIPPQVPGEHLSYAFYHLGKALLSIDKGETLGLAQNTSNNVFSYLGSVRSNQSSIGSQMMTWPYWQRYCESVRAQRAFLAEVFAKRPSSVGAKTRRAADPLLSREEWIALAKKNKLAALRHPNAPIDLIPDALAWQREAGREKRLAALEANPALDLLLLEDASPENPFLYALWQARYRVAVALLETASQRVTTKQSLLWAYRCAKTALPRYHRDFPGDKNAQELLHLTRACLEGRDSFSTVKSIKRWVADAFGGEGSATISMIVFAKLGNAVVDLLAAPTAIHNAALNYSALRAALYALQPVEKLSARRQWPHAKANYEAVVDLQRRLEEVKKEEPSSLVGAKTTRQSRPPVFPRGFSDLPVSAVFEKDAPKWSKEKYIEALTNAELQPDDALRLLLAAYLREFSFNNMSIAFGAHLRDNPAYPLWCLEDPEFPLKCAAQLRLVNQFREAQEFLEGGVP